MLSSRKQVRGFTPEPNAELVWREYQEALLSEGVLKERSLELLSILYSAPDCRSTGTQLAEVLGYPDFPPVNALLGKLGKRIAQHLSLTPEDIDAGFRGLWWQVIVDGRPEDQGFTWSLKGNLVDALVELRLLQELETSIYPETVSTTEDLYEGAKKTITVNSYERNRTARTICIKHFGTNCHVCDMSFESVYGQLGKDFIHVHHLVELSTIASEYKVDPIQDLRPVCPNCHAMLHQTKPAMSIEKLLSLMLTKKAA